MKEIKQELQDYFAKHEAVREVKRVNDKAYYKEKDKQRQALIAEEHQYRVKRDEKIEEFQETVHKIDQQWSEKMRQYYEEQYSTWLDECSDALAQLKKLKAKLMQGKNRNVAYVSDRQEQAHDLNQHIISRQREIAAAKDTSEHPEPATIHLAEELIEKIKQSEKRRVKLMKEFIEER